MIFGKDLPAGEALKFRQARMIERGWPPDFVLSMDIAEFMEWYERYKAIDGAQRTLSKG